MPWRCAASITAMATRIATVPPSGTRSTRSSRRTTVSMRLIRHRHGAQRHALARREFLGCALELAAGGEDVAPARRAHRRRIAGVEDVLGKFLDLLPVGAFIAAARPRIERDQVDLGRNALEQLDQ